MLFYLELLIGWLDDLIVKGAELSGLNTNKHFLTGMFLVIRYYDELKEAAAKTTNTLDDKAVDRVYEAAKHFWPTSDPNFPFTEAEKLSVLQPPPEHREEDPDLDPHV